MDVGVVDQPGGADEHTDGRSVVGGQLQSAAAAAAVASGDSEDDIGQQGKGGPVRQDALRCELGSAGPGVQSCAHPLTILYVINTSL